MISRLISELVAYGMNKGLIETDDRVYITNRLLELFGVSDYEYEEIKPREIHLILEDMLVYAANNGLLEEDTITQRDLFDTRIMGIITPMPSVLRSKFKEKLSDSAREATDWYYGFSKATNYIRQDRIARDEKWVSNTEYGDIDITINLSKPEKDPRDIARAAAQSKESGGEYPKCLLCVENEGYAGHLNHPARQNHRIIPLTLAGENYFLQYSPYVYYNEHCIVFNEKHIPMKIDESVFVKLLEFVKLFPHYIVGSNADLPIVGGSILSHDHFQGGSYDFAMARAPYEYMFKLKGFEELNAGIIKWPMSVIRIQGKNLTQVAQASDMIHKAWRGYTDTEAFIFHETDGVPHNTITPIARMKDGMYEMDLVLRNNITTEKAPWGVYHPEEKYHHIKKENIGLIEVMGLAVLPARLKKEMSILAEAILNCDDIRSIADIKKHADWVDEWRDNYDITGENVHGIIRDEIGKVFVKVLECCGVFKRDEKGFEGFRRFISYLEKAVFVKEEIWQSQIHGGHIPVHN